MADPRVCVIIPTLRNAEELEIALDGLSKQTWVGPLEVVIVGPTGDPGQDIAVAKGMTWIDDQGNTNRTNITKWWTTQYYANREVQCAC